MQRQRFVKSSYTTLASRMDCYSRRIISSSLFFVATRSLVVTTNHWRKERPISSTLRSTPGEASIGLPLSECRMPETARNFACCVGNGSSDDASSETELPLVIIIAGPTGVGKSAVASLLCSSSIATTILRHRHNNHKKDFDLTHLRLVGNIISADSVQAYKGVHIGANKPSKEERSSTPHHLISIVDGKEGYAYNAAEWMRDALFVIDSLVSRQEVDGVAAKNEFNESHCNKDGDEKYDRDDSTDESYDKRRAEIQRDLLQAKKTRHDSEDGIEREPSQQYYDMPVLPVVVGGTMMYLQWLVHGRPDAMKPSKEAVKRAAMIVRKYQDSNLSVDDASDSVNDDEFGGKNRHGLLTFEIKRSGWDAAVHFVSSLGSVFKHRVEKLQGQDWYRLRRILEVAFTVLTPTTNSTETDNSTNNTIEEQINALYSGHRNGGLEDHNYDVRCFFLCPDDRMKHTDIVDRRCEEMLIRGLLKETTKLSLSGQLPEDGQLSRAIGYRQTLNYLLRHRKNNKEDEDDDLTSFFSYLDEFTTATRRYAKKQMQWFRRDEKFLFVPVSLSKPSQDRVNDAATIIRDMCLLSRQLYEKELIMPEATTITTLSAKTSGGVVDKKSCHTMHFTFPTNNEAGIVSNDDNDERNETKHLSLSAHTKLINERQGKDMRLFIPKRYLFQEGSMELANVLTEAKECTIQMTEKNSLIDE